MYQTSHLKTKVSKYMFLYIYTHLRAEEIPGREVFGKGWAAQLLLSCLRASRTGPQLDQRHLGQIALQRSVQTGCKTILSLHSSDPKKDQTKGDKHTARAGW